jgi:hypothetical protein
MAKFFNERGEIVVTDSDVCPPGCHVRAGVMMLDGLDDTQREIARSYSPPARIVDAFDRPAGHAPGYCFDAAADDARAEAYQARKAQLADAWRGPLAATHTAAPTDAQLTAADAAEAAYAAHDAWLCNAWRTPR